MDHRASCEQCAAIARELGEAYADAWLYGDQAFKDAWLATYKMIGGTDEDAARAEELCLEAASPVSARIKQALLNKLAHEARSGHKILMPADP